MLQLCRTSRGQIACGLGGVLIAVLAAACLWAFSPSVTAGDEKPAKKEAITLPDCAIPPLPGLSAEAPPKPPLPPAKPVAAVPSSEPPPAPAAAAARLPGLPPDASSPSGAGASTTPVVEPAPPPPAPEPKSVPSLAPLPAVNTTAPPPQPAPDAQDVKQLVAQLTDIRAERVKLDEREKQTIQSIRRKYQDQKRALEQLESELRQMGISVVEAAADVDPTGSRPVGFPTKRR